MTEADWFACGDPKLMLTFLEAQASERKVRLFACACCRRIWSALKRTGSRKSVEVCELYADNLTTSEKLKSANDSAHDAFARVQWAAESDEETTPARAAIWLGGGTNFSAVWVADEAAATFGVKARERDYKRRKKASGGKGQDEPWEQYNDVYRAAESEEEQTQTKLLRCVIGNPFCPITLAAAQRTATIVSLAQGAYDERQLPSGELDLHRLAVLADALEEAGASGEMMVHLHSPGPHVRGCHVIDLCLGLT